MTSTAQIMLSAVLLIAAIATANHEASALPDNSSHVPQYTTEGKLMLPSDYRQWVFLTSGVDMSYSPNSQGADHHMFDNVFVNPESYKAFLATGTWPDKTILAMETRGAQTKGSINKSGHFQTPEIMGLEFHIKDEARFPGKWAFFAFDDGSPVEIIPKEATCYSCHQQHGAVDTTFTQFYPTLIGIAKEKKTVSSAFLKAEADADSKK